ncbi:MAG: glycosyltransferase [Bdellovibrionaceae bacterium]|jgi:adsorption protein B|nr:glycosyltransferase [Pseudobdellovibrionaceae bacterium]
MSELFLFLLKLTAVAFAIYALDDFIFESLKLLKKVKPQHLKDEDLERMLRKSQKKLGIIVANWKEEDVIEKMVIGNLGAIYYRNYQIWLGVYPNDMETKEKALSLERRFPGQVRVVINSRPGPTSKGQMLNEILNKILNLPTNESSFDAVIMHDSEDMIHPLELITLNDALDHYDYIQTPVFSLPAQHLFEVRNIYLDEFAQGHTLDLLLRREIGVAIPSAGVGTCLSRRLLEKLKEAHGFILNEKALTEDYQLGLMSAQLGLPSTMLCYYRIKRDTQEKDFIATFELFPNSWWPSIRQKTRWTYGISLQSWQVLGWVKGHGSWIQNLKENYFLWRDRRGVLNSWLMIWGWIYLISNLWFPNMRAQLHSYNFLGSFAIMTSLIVLWRRHQSVRWVYGKSYFVAVLGRYILASLINAAAGIRAIYQFGKNWWLGHAPKWDKTTHELPVHFGNTQVIFAQGQLSFLEAEGPARLPNPQKTQTEKKIPSNTSSISASDSPG